jgi:competence protein ComEC
MSGASTAALPGRPAGLAGGISAIASSWVATERARLVLWLPVAFAIGIAAYFALAAEPDPLWRWVAAALALPALGLAVRAPVAGWAVGLAAMAALGAALASWHAARQPPMPDLPRGAVLLSGTVQRVEQLPEGRRVTLAAARLDAGAPMTRLIRVRLRTEDPARPQPGDVLSVRALVRGPAAPAYPGAWDFQRAAWFSGLGGSGFAIGPAETQPPAAIAAPPFAALRTAIEARVAAELPGATGAIAAALLAGGQSAIPAPDIAAMRDSGLAHILSVSGLHITIVMGLTFGLVRALLAAIPALALRWPLKALAALAALVAGGCYMVLTGTQVPMQRSFAMAALATLALLAGRRALTLRAWALALLVVLALEPVALMGPSFQMSFAAVLVLIAGWEALRPRLALRRGQRGWPMRIALMLGGIVMTSLLAGAATTPFGLHHFGRLQVYGVVANALAMPVTSFLVMPAGMVAAALMPLGLDAPALVVMGWGIAAILAIAHEVASWPGAAVAMAPIPAWSLAVVAAGMVWLCLWRGVGRWLGAVLLVAGLAAGVALHRPPDMLVSADGRLIAARVGEAVLMQRTAGASGLTRDSWLRVWGGGAAQPWPVRGEAASGAVSCTEGACRLGIGAAPAVILLRGDPPAAACATAALVVSAEPVRGRCAARVVDRFAVWRHGAHAIWLRPDAAAVRVVHDRQWRGDRPWVPPQPQPRGPPTSREPAAATE